MGGGIWRQTASAARQAANPAHSQLSSPRRDSGGGGGSGGDSDRDPPPSQRTTMPYSQLGPQDLLFSLASTMRVVQSPHLTGKVERRVGIVFFKKTAKQNKTKKVPRTSSPSDEILPPAAHSHPSRPGTHPQHCALTSGRGGHRGALTWHLLLSVQVVAVFTWVFK